MSGFVHLHVHSDYSPMEGVSSVNALCETAKAHGATRLALTDTNGLYGAIRFLQAARDASLAPILGAELVSGTHRAVILVKSPEAMPISADYCRIDTATPHSTVSRPWPGTAQG